MLLCSIMSHAGTITSSRRGRWCRALVVAFFRLARGGWIGGVGGRVAWVRANAARAGRFYYIYREEARNT